MYHLKSNEEFLEEICRKHFHKIYKFCKKRLKGSIADLAEDCTQATFLQAGKQAAKLKLHPNIEGWLYKTSRNQVNSAFRKDYTKRKYEIIFQKNLNEELVNDRYILDDVMLSTTNIDSIVDIVLSKLNHREFELYMDYFQCRLTISQLATKHKVSKTAITSRIYRLKQKLKLIAREALMNT